MIDKETVINGLQECDLNGGLIGNCPYKDAVFSLLKDREMVVHCGDCENFCFCSISPNAGRCMLTNMMHSKNWFCANGKREETEGLK